MREFKRVENRTSVGANGKMENGKSNMSAKKANQRNSKGKKVWN